MSGSSLYARAMRVMGGSGHKRSPDANERVRSVPALFDISRPMAGYVVATLNQIRRGISSASASVADDVDDLDRTVRASIRPTPALEVRIRWRTRSTITASVRYSDEGVCDVTFCHAFGYRCSCARSQTAESCPHIEAVKVVAGQ